MSINNNIENKDENSDELLKTNQILNEAKNGAKREV